MKKRYKKNKNINQNSFYFEDYLETNKKNKVSKKLNNSQDRIYLLFFFFFSLILIFSIKITHISLDKKEIFNIENQKSQFSLLRRDIVDRNGVIISRNIKTFHAAINPKLIKDKKNFLIKSNGYSKLFLLLIANLNFADLDRLFLLISSFDGTNILFLYCSNKAVSGTLVSGKYLDGLDLFFEKLVKKYFTILSSIEWKLIIKILPPGFNFFVAFITPFINSVISLLTKILSA